METVKENVEKPIQTDTAPAVAETATPASVPEEAESLSPSEAPASPEAASEAAEEVGQETPAENSDLSESADSAAAPRHAAYMSMLGNDAAQTSRPAFLSYIRPGFWDNVHKV